MLIDMSNLDVLQLGISFYFFYIFHMLALCKHFLIHFRDISHQMKPSSSQWVDEWIVWYCLIWWKNIIPEKKSSSHTSITPSDEQNLMVIESLLQVFARVMISLSKSRRWIYERSHEMRKTPSRQSHVRGDMHFSIRCEKNMMHPIFWQHIIWMTRWRRSSCDSWSEARSEDSQVCHVYLDMYCVHFSISGSPIFSNTRSSIISSFVRTHPISIRPSREIISVIPSSLCSAILNQVLIRCLWASVSICKRLLSI